MEKKDGLIILIEGAIITALAQALNYIPHSVGASSIEVVYGLVPMVIFALRRGLKPGLTAGLVWGILDLILRGFSSGGFLNPLQGFIEYPIAFAAIGLAGIGSTRVKEKIQEGKSTFFVILIYSTIGFFAKYFLHFIAGGIYWGLYAPKNMNPWIYSLVINGGSFLANLIMLTIILVFLNRFINRIIKV
ncbi:energy-coupled thiamine transporter ThiT [Companilactobacillus metriopterae]|uniref:energy-coupled thiamine transporter ThiT n=1 Tax=Companilactobacillus metriopterae TaxID=1909267 RepID=UPI00100B2D91|nr:energy-coupled thiamine transporter ThiT [Companilactobacillus metriopterae]